MPNLLSFLFEKNDPVETPTETVQDFVQHNVTDPVIKRAISIACAQAGIHVEECADIEEGVVLVNDLELHTPTAALYYIGRIGDTHFLPSDAESTAQLMDCVTAVIMTWVMYRADSELLTEKMLPEVLSILETGMGEDAWLYDYDLSTMADICAYSFLYEMDLNVGGNALQELYLKFPTAEAYYKKCQEEFE